MTSVTSGYQTEGSPSDLSVSLGGIGGGGGGGGGGNGGDGREEMGVRSRVGREQERILWRDS